MQPQERRSEDFLMKYLKAEFDALKSQNERIERAISGYESHVNNKTLHLCNEHAEKIKNIEILVGQYITDKQVKKGIFIGYKWLIAGITALGGFIMWLVDFYKKIGG